MEGAAVPILPPELWNAASRGQVGKARQFLEHGTDVSAKNIDDDAWFGHQHAALRLSEQGADVSDKDNDGNTSLHTAAENGHCEMLRLLLNQGADVSAENTDGKTPSDVSTNRLSGPAWNHEEVTALLSGNAGRGAPGGRDTPGYVGSVYGGASRTAWSGFYHQDYFPGAG